MSTHVLYRFQITLNARRHRRHYPNTVRQGRIRFKSIWDRYWTALSIPLPYDLLNDFAPIAALEKTALIIVGRKNSAGERFTQTRRGTQKFENRGGSLLRGFLGHVVAEHAKGVPTEADRNLQRQSMASFARRPNLGRSGRAA
jgi:hypothetical protein